MHLLKSLEQSNWDIRLLWGSVFLRMGSYGLTNQVLTLYLKELEISESQIGWFMTLTLIGDSMISYYLTWNADRIGRRRVMFFGLVMMVGSGVVFAVSGNFWILLVAAIIGVISPSGDETGPFKSVEEATIAHLTPENHRPEIFAFHGLFATGGAALGSLVCGLVVDYLNLSCHWDILSCYRVVFVGYACIAMVKVVLMLVLSEKCEVSYGLKFVLEPELEPELETESDCVDSNYTENSSLLDGSNIHEDEEHGEVTVQKDLQRLSPATKHYLWRLLIIFMLDSLGYGFMPSSWVVYYFKKTFKVTATGLGTLFFLTNAIDSISSLPSAWFAKLLGPVKAILLTQAPSAVFFILIAFTRNFMMAATYLLLYYSTTTMDVVPRQVLLTSIIPKGDLTKVMGIVNIAKTFARCIGPVFTGKLAQHKLLKFGFLINGSCTLIADVILATSFLKLDHDILSRQSVYQPIK